MMKYDNWLNSNDWVEEWEKEMQELVDKWFQDYGETPLDLVSYEDWLEDKWESEVGDYVDSAYQQYKDDMCERRL